MNNKPLSIRVESAAQEANAVLLSVLAAGATWFAPLPEAVMTAQAIQQIFGLPVGVAACVAASLELIGVSANAALNDAREFNARAWIGVSGKRLQQPRYPLEDEARPRNLLTGFYVTTAGIVWATAIYNVAVEGAPLIRLLACLFPVASAIGAMVANSRASLRRKVAGMAVEETPVAKVTTPVAVEGKPMAQPPAVIPPQEITLAQFRTACAGLNGDRPTTGVEVNEWLTANGYVEKPETTARRWAQKAEV